MSRKERVVSISAIALLIAAVTALVIVLSSLDAIDEGPRVTVVELDFDYFNTVTEVKDFGGASRSDFEKYCSAIKAEFSKYHELCDIYNEYEGIVNLKTINDSAGKTVKISEELFEILEYSKLMYELTEGSLNVAMGALLEVWHKYRSEANENPFDDTDNRLPTQSELEAAAKHCDMSKLILDRDAMTVTLLDPYMSLDLGAVAKGYATERAARVIKEMGAEGIVINAGGNTRMVGSHPSGEGWTVKIRNPYDAFADMKELILPADSSAVTSGGYERYFTVSDKKYHHIINEKTLYPADFHASVTVIHSDSGLADCLSTALFNCDKETGARIIENVRNAGLGEAVVEYMDRQEQRAE